LQEINLPIELLLLLLREHCIFYNILGTITESIGVKILNVFRGDTYYITPFSFKWFRLRIVKVGDHSESIISFGHKISDDALMGATLVYFLELFLFVKLGTHSILKFIGQRLLFNTFKLIRMAPNHLDSI
jgi:hypothetical protein